MIDLLRSLRSTFATTTHGPRLGLRERRRPPAFGQVDPQFRAVRLPERLGVVMTFHRGSSRLQIELWTTPVGDQLRTYMDGQELHGRLVRDDHPDTVAEELAAMRRDVLTRGWIEGPMPSA